VPRQGSAEAAVAGPQTPRSAPVVLDESFRIVFPSEDRRFDPILLPILEHVEDSVLVGLLCLPGKILDLALGVVEKVEGVRFGIPAKIVGLTE